MAYADDDYENSVVLFGLLLYLDNVTDGEPEDCDALRREEGRKKEGSEEGAEG